MLPMRRLQMTKDNPWAGISNMGALDQKLYQPSKNEVKKEENPHITEDKTITQVTSTTISEATYDNEEVRMTLPLPSFTLDTLQKMEKEIFKKRSKENRARVRVTKNSVARAWLKLLENVKIDMNNIADEEDLYNRMKKTILI